jgi:2-C-methyl-D-erythritol 4-phosphate cytidylyltransferase
MKYLNVSVILAAGNSTRFDNSIPKQLFEINNKPVVQHSIDILEKYTDDVIIVTNSNCKIESKHTILINDVNDRLTSIKTAIDYITVPYHKIIIHDAARPFITDEYIKNLIDSKSEHSQYYMKLTNGLAMKNEFGWEIPNREDFIELCTPQCTDYNLFKFIFKTYIETGKQCEILPCLSYLSLNPELIEGHYKYLRKINTLEDIY